MSSSYFNLLLSIGGAEALALQGCERTSLAPLQVLREAGQPLDYVYFPESSVISLVASLAGGRDVEVGVIGPEGVTGEPIIMGNDRFSYAMHVQTPGEAIRVPAPLFRSVVLADRRFNDLMLRFVSAQHAQVVSTLIARSRSTIEERLARWILMTLDRVGGDTFSITHASLAWLLCTQRPRVTDAMHILEGEHLIRSTRGGITLLRRDGLEAATGGSYGFSEREYERLIGLDFRHRARTSSKRLYAEPDKEEAGSDY